MFDTTRRLVALGIVTAWVEWLDQRPNRVIVKQSGQPFPDREDLDHQDQTRWPKGPSGDPKDPWARTMHVYFADEKTSAGFTFASSAWGAAAASVERLAPGEPVGEDRHGLGVDRGGVPLEDGGEVGLAFVPPRAALPAVGR